MKPNQLVMLILTGSRRVGHWVIVRSSFRRECQKNFSLMTPNTSILRTFLNSAIPRSLGAYMSQVKQTWKHLSLFFRCTHFEFEGVFSQNAYNTNATSPLSASQELIRRSEREWGSSTMPLVSILIPAYNAEPWVAATIRSALAQTWPRIEIIVVDDGSSDQTPAIARQFAAQGVLVVEQKNQGASAARNKAFSLSHGEYIQWLDADDLLAPDKIAIQMEVVVQGTAKRTVLSSSWGRFIHRPSRAKFIPSSLWCDLSPVEWLLRKMGQNIFMQTSTWLVSRELTEAAGPWDTRLLGDDDGEYFCRVVLASEAIRFVPEARVYYRSFQSSSLSYIGRSPKKIEAHWLSMRLHIQYLRSQENSPRVHVACLQYLRDCLISFYPERPDIVREAAKLAIELGGKLGAPPLSWKYSWIEMLFGWGVAKPVLLNSRKLRWSFERRWDRMLFQIQRGN
jgi:glycosyltransferase involved in cell wall biosynthesis